MEEDIVSISGRKKFDLFSLQVKKVENDVWNPSSRTFKPGLDFSSYLTLECFLNCNIYRVIGEEFYDSNTDISCFSIFRMCEIGVNPISLLINRLWHRAALDYRLFMFDKECGKKIMRETQRYREDLFSNLESLAHFVLSADRCPKFRNLTYMMLAIPLFLLHNEYHLCFPMKVCSVSSNFCSLPRHELTFGWFFDQLN